MKSRRFLVHATYVALAVAVLAYSSSATGARARAAARMAESAQRFVRSLTPDQKTKAILQFDDANRVDWHWIPRDRKGIPLAELTSQQKTLAYDLIKTGLGAVGYQKVRTTMSLDNIVGLLERTARALGKPVPLKPDGTMYSRGSDLYYVSIFGTPDASKGRWGWRVEGHHVSVSVTIADGQVLSNVPLFIGANPSQIVNGGAWLGENFIPLPGSPKDMRALVAEQDKAYDLLQSLDQHRVQGPTFLVEYDCTQESAHHIHSLWRDFDGRDFGEDLLTEHLLTTAHQTLMARRD